jgi:hypothetical protein
MKKATPWIVLLVVLGGIAAWYFSAWKTPESHPSVVTLPPPATVMVEPEAAFPVEEILVQEEVPVEPLPELANSDQEITEGLAALLGAEYLGAYFNLEQVISRVVATIDSLDSRQIAPLVLPVKPAAGNFQVQGEDSYTISPANAQRYSAYILMAGEVETHRLINLYVRYYPLFQQAYAELGYGDRYFNDRLVEVIDHLLAVPEPQGEVLLIKPEAVYEFADPELEALSAGRKMLIRIGSDNAAIVLDKLVEIRSAVTNLVPNSGS